MPDTRRRPMGVRPPGPLPVPAPRETRTSSFIPREGRTQFWKPPVVDLYWYVVDPSTGFLVAFMRGHLTQRRVNRIRRKTGLRSRQLQFKELPVS